MAAQTDQNNQLADFLAGENPKPKQYTVEEIFGFPSKITLPGYAPGHPLVPQSAEYFVWDSTTARDLIEWLTEERPDPLWISGPTGCGKTEALKTLFSRLHIPTVIVSAKKSTEADDILGRVQLINGSTVFVPGDLLHAYSQGYAIIFDEIDSYNPDVLMACHRLLERQTLCLDDGSMFQPAPRNLIAATANTRGDGDGADIYTGTNNFNLATLNRFDKIVMDYPETTVEEEILQQALPTLDHSVIGAMVKVATDIRKAWSGGSCPGPISIRDLKRWGRKLILGGNRTDVSPIYHAFDKAFGFGTDIHVRGMLYKLIESHFDVQAPELEEVAR